ncbi:MAG TPA: prolyl oligopeptidase family serine peptidase [Roseiarcus sp.]|nr:prolyl oligopeptidase family serine peptidase [Roseiarcus sp.]
MDPRPTLEAPDDDPYLWLEEIDGKRALAWAAEQTALTLKAFGGAAFARDRDTLAAMWDRKDKIPLVTRRGGEVYNYWLDAEHKRGLWRRAPWAAYRDGEPEWEILLDLDALAAAEGEDWVWAGATMRPGEPRQALLALSRGGGDACVLREYDLDAKVFAGFAAPEAKAHADWVDADTLIVCSPHGEGMATRSGYARTVRLWRRGEPFAAAEVVFEGAAEDISVFAGLDRSVEPPRWAFGRRTSFFAYELWLGDRERRAKIEAPADADKDAHGDWLIVRLRSPWLDHAAGALLAAPLAGGEFATLFEPSERRALEGHAWIGDKLVLSVLDDLAPTFEVLTPGEVLTSSAWTRRRLDGLPQIGVVNVSALDAYEPESNGEALAFAQDPLTAMEMRLLDLSGDAPSAAKVLRRMPALFDAAGLVVTRHDAVAQDGARIPYVQVGPPNPEDAPVHLYGYGGFEVSERPYYRSHIGKLWLERGGVSVVANIRGGGEFGPAWHKAGVREGKRIAQDDFAAVAADLVRRGVATAGRIAAEGGSNGGLLIANMLTRHPEKFGALFCTIPLIDMRRYSKLSAGASWIEEYGDPDKPEDWAFLQQISAYHLAAPGKPYPPILIATTKADDRVHPGHARKMAAKLQALGYGAHFYEPVAGGHGYGKDNFERAGFVALGLDFLWSAVGGAGR